MLATNNPKEAFGARIRLAWALAHSERGHQDYVRAKSMTTALLEEKREDLDTQKVIELLYVKAVANLNAGDLITAHYTVTELLQRSPRSHQGLALKGRIHDELLRKGLTGIGILAGVVTVGATLITKLARK